MRITNQMSMNRMLMNINRNARTVDDLYMQLGSGKKIQHPSDNPIIASRALKFRTTVSDTAQYKRNAAQAKSWMDMTQEGMKNTLDSLEEIRALLVNGSTDTLTPEDKEILLGKIRTKIDEIGGEMNAQYGGRYVLSGYRTDEPPIMTSDETRGFEIRQDFYAGDIQETSSYIRDDSTNPPTVTVQDIAKIDLPYTFDKNGAANLTFDGNPPTIKAANDPTRYTVGPNDVNYIAETGELILGENIVNTMRNNNNDVPVNCTYEIDKLAEGDLNPVVYFDCTDADTGKIYNMNDQELQFEFGANTRVQINNLAKDTYTATLYAELTNLYNQVSGVEITSADKLTAYYSSAAYADPVTGALGTTLTEDEVKKLVDDHIAEETKKAEDYTQQAFSSALGRHDGHTAVALKEYTTLGSRMNRVDMTITRLEQNTVSYTQLMSENENVDYYEAIMSLSSMEAVYSASMMAGSRISQMSLANYIN